MVIGKYTEAIGEEIRKMHAEGLSCLEMAKKVGVSATTIRRWHLKLGLRPLKMNSEFIDRGDSGRRDYTVCWDCQRAAGKEMCSWAARLEPVEGWDAVETIVNQDTNSYSVRACPLFIPDAVEGGEES